MGPARDIVVADASPLNYLVQTPFGENKRLAAVVGPANSCFRNGQLLL